MQVLQDVCRIHEAQDAIDSEHIHDVRVIECCGNLITEAVRTSSFATLHTPYHVPQPLHVTVTMMIPVQGQRDQ